MTFIVTAGAREVDVRYASPGDIDIFSIAWSLSQINRFNGHAIRPYSVAEHSLLVCEIAERDFGLGVHGQLAALLHDAHESVSGDMHSPGKRELGDAWHGWELRWVKAVRSAFSIATAGHAHRDAIHQADLMALATERKALMPAAPTPWPALAGVEPVGWVDLYSSERRAMGWEDWRDAFLDRYHELDFARNDEIERQRAAGSAA